MVFTTGATTELCNGTAAEYDGPAGDTCSTRAGFATLGTSAGEKRSGSGGAFCLPRLSDRDGLAVLC